MRDSNKQLLRGSSEDNNPAAGTRREENPGSGKLNHLLRSRSCEVIRGVDLNSGQFGRYTLPNASEKQMSVRWWEPGGWLSARTAVVARARRKEQFVFFFSRPFHSTKAEGPSEAEQHCEPVSGALLGCLQDGDTHPRQTPKDSWSSWEVTSPG